MARLTPFKRIIKEASNKESDKKWKYMLYGMAGGGVSDALQASLRRKSISGLGFPIGGLSGLSIGTYLDLTKNKNPNVKNKDPF